jgi:citrate synthase
MYRIMLEQKLENASQACLRLNVSAQTLYAYVSRGLVRAIRHPDDSRKSLYFSIDVDHLIARQTRGRSRQEIARSTVDFGEPVFQSKVSSIDSGQFYYRGKNAVDLSRTANLEDVFELLCKAQVNDSTNTGKSYYISKHRTPFARFIDALANQAIQNNAFGNKPAAFNLLKLMASNAVKHQGIKNNQLIHQQLANAWSSDPRAADLIRRALVLSADHELNASTYASRITASAGASLAACLLTGISTLSGSYHGGLTDLCSEWMLESAKGDSGEIELIEGQLPPGFGHRLYPNGDPRAVEILKCCPAPKSWQGISRTILKSNSSGHPTLDFGLATLEYQLKLPKGAGFSIFAVGRTVGWLAHCFEQRKTGSLIRPRASI